jgi:hypothetical protein
MRIIVVVVDQIEALKLVVGTFSNAAPDFKGSIP